MKAPNYDSDSAIGMPEKYGRQNIVRRWSVSKLVESHIKRKIPLEKYGIVPKESFLEHLSSCKTCMVTYNFFDNVEQGSIVLKRADKFRFCKEGARGRRACRAGPGPSFSLPVSRAVCPPTDSAGGFSESIANLRTSEMWLAEFLDGDFQATQHPKDGEGNKGVG
uniref:Uncharacterized protein n=1 Tax=Kalanchoe fedtschenkoi TaxID=63787 RepID=A0A7N0UXA8_KALFE